MQLTDATQEKIARATLKSAAERALARRAQCVVLDAGNAIKVRQRARSLRRLLVCSAAQGKPLCAHDLET